MAWFAVVFMQFDVIDSGIIHIDPQQYHWGSQTNTNKLALYDVDDNHWKHILYKWKCLSVCSLFSNGFVYYVTDCCPRPRITRQFNKWRISVFSHVCDCIHSILSKRALKHSVTNVHSIHLSISHSHILTHSHPVGHILFVCASAAIFKPSIYCHLPRACVSVAPKTTQIHSG